MEYANGGELFDLIVKNTKIDELLAVKFFQQLVAGIEYIHKLGVVHRDLKPENLLLDYNTNIKIVDFGLSNTYTMGEMLKTACGSPCYAAPEMISGGKYNPLKADIWSSGVILFAMVCGYLPFEDANTSKLYKKITTGDFKFPGFISDEVKDLIDKILNVNPDSRYTISDIRKHRWYNMIKQQIYPGILVGYDDILVDNEILKQLRIFKYDTRLAQKCIEANKHNSVTAAYYLLLKRHIVNGGQSVADYPHQYSPTKTMKIRPNTLKLEHIIRPPVIDLFKVRLGTSRLSNFEDEKEANCTNRKKVESMSPRAARRYYNRTGRLTRKTFYKKINYSRAHEEIPEKRSTRSKRFKYSRLSVM